MRIVAGFNQRDDSLNTVCILFLDQASHSFLKMPKMHRTRQDSDDFVFPISDGYT